jgi:nitrogen regulatory protein P-II 1
VKRIEAIIRPSQLGDVTRALPDGWIAGLTVSEVDGYGRPRARLEAYRRGEDELDTDPRIKVEIVVPDALVARVIDDLTSWVRTGRIDDGKIFVTDVELAVRVRTGERGAEAL